MQYYSTNNRQLKVSLQQAVIEGLAPDNGLYMPEYFRPLPNSFFESLQSLSLKEIAWQVTNNMIGEDLPALELNKIIEHTIQFDAPLVRIDEDIYALELFHGPTLAFKDFGARFLSGLLGYYAKQQSKEITILVATSGDTGSAVANAFLRVPGTQVVVLYPSGKVSEIQEKQFTTLGENIIALEVDGTFDDCQWLVKQAFLDKELKQKLFLTSANSINIARLMPQSFYYFYAYAQLGTTGNPLVISVPSGNFGNLTAGLIAKKLGLPIKQFLAATNANKVVPEFLKTGEFKPRPSMQTISNAMDVGNPSNFPRMLELYNNDFDLLSQDITGYSFNDESTCIAMRNVYDKTGYCMDPHGAIGYQGLLEFKKSNSAYTGIFLETAHPAKFKEVVEDTIQHSVDLPERLKEFMAGEKKSISISSNFLEFKSLLPTLLS